MFTAFWPHCAKIFQHCENFLNISYLGGKVDFLSRRQMHGFLQYLLWLTPVLRNSCQIFRHHLGMDGFFLSILKRKATSITYELKSLKLWFKVFIKVNKLRLSTAGFKSFPYKVTYETLLITYYQIKVLNVVFSGNTDSIKINRPDHNICMYWTNFWQPTAHLQQKFF